MTGIFAGETFPDYFLRKLTLRHPLSDSTLTFDSRLKQIIYGDKINFI